MPKTVRLFTCLFLLFLLKDSLFCPLYAQTRSAQQTHPLTYSIPAEQGVSSERLARIDSLFLRSIARNDIPGAVALVARNGKIVYHKAFGIADMQTGRNFQVDDIFRIASQTKAITATAVMMLWEEGLFGLDDPVSRYLPGFEEPHILVSFNEADSTYYSVPSANPVTIRQLLTHTSGIGYGSIDRDERFRKIYAKAGVIDLSASTAENVYRIAALPLHHSPGEAYTYSYGLDILGYLVEVLSGMPFNDFLKKRLFDPLGMSDTFFYLPESLSHRLVPVQIPEGASWVRHTDTVLFNAPYPETGSMPLISGGAGLYSTATDYARFLQMYLNHGVYNGWRFLSRTTISFMMANQIGDLMQAEGLQHGLAFRVLDEHGEDMGGRGHRGAFNFGGYFNTQFFADPQEQIIGIIMKQTRFTRTDDTSWKFRQIVFQSIDD